MLKQINFIAFINRLRLVIVIAWAAGPAVAALPDNCTIQCVSPYGKVLGIAPGQVTAYSNCNAQCIVKVPHQVNTIFTGIEWQCVEFARRWLLKNKGVVYGDVNIAADIWQLNTVTRIADNQSLTLQTYPNGASRLPKIGDLLIYAQAYLGTGHVAVVTEVDLKQGHIKVAEQNFTNEIWPGDYARQIAFIHKDNRYWLLDSYLLGWKSIQMD